MYYSIIASEGRGITGEEYIVYGIEYNDGAKHIIIEDITENRSRLEKLVKMCNELELDVLHINEVVEDFLSE